MSPVARTPEELDLLIEDAFVVRDPAQLRALFTDGGVLATAATDREFRGGEAIGRAAAELWAADRTYVAGARHVVQARGTALVVSDAGIHVACRNGDGAWRAAICLLDFDRTSIGRTQ